MCEDAVQGKKLLHAAINALFSVPISASPEDSSTNQSDEDTEEVKPAEEDTEEVKPALLWAALYMQELTMVCPLSLSLTLTKAHTNSSFMLIFSPSWLHISKFEDLFISIAKIEMSQKHSWFTNCTFLTITKKR